MIRRLALGAAALVALGVATAAADPPPAAPEAAAKDGPAAPAPSLTEPAAGPSPDDFLTGDWGGRRSAWRNRGVDFSASYFNTLYATVAGGHDHGFINVGSGVLGLDFDLAKLAGWENTHVYFGANLSHGPSLTARFTGETALRADDDYADGLYFDELWIERTWFDGFVSLRAGKMASDEEFPLYTVADAIPLPIYHSGTPALRLLFTLNRRLSVHAAIFDGNATSPGRSFNHYGTYLRLARRDGATLSGQISLNLGNPDAASFPSGTLKAGIVHSTRDYADVETGDTLRGNTTYFFNYSQFLWQENPTVKDDTQGLSLALLGQSAQTDRNTFHYALGGSVSYTGLFPGRDDDVTTIGCFYVHFSAHYAQTVVDAGDDNVVFENALQATHQFTLKKYWSVTPQLDYVVHPGGATTLRNSLTLSLRTSVTF